MTTMTAISGSIFHNRVYHACADAAVAAKEGFNSLTARSWRVMTKSIDIMSQIMCSFDGVDYGSKFIGSLCLLVQLWFRDTGAPIAAAIGSIMREVTSFTGSVSFVNRYNVFISGKYLEQRICKQIYSAGLVIKTSCDTMKYLAAQGVINLANIARAIGGNPLVKITSKVALGTVSNVVCIIACVFDIADAGIAISKARLTGKPTTKEWLTIVNDAGKIGCCALGFMYFSYVFAAVALTTGVTSLMKVAYDKM
jgi:hypothetical protein